MTKITIYSTATCGYCHMLKDYLQSKNVEFQEKHVDQDQKLVKELMDKSGQLGVPFTVIEQEGLEPISILGFNKPKIDQVLQLT
jgi:glutaredoxin 3